jgi:Arc/MetJ-type ribon-helix-helix transcriptional regulator
MNQDEWKEWKDWYREAIQEWKQKSQKALQEWQKQYQEWKRDQPKPEGSLPLLPPIPPIPPLLTASTSRSNVVASRIADEDLQIIDMLIEAGVFSTRSEAVAYLVNEGIKARHDVLDKVSASLREIRDIRKRAEEQVKKLKEEIGFSQSQAATVEEEIDETAEQRGPCSACGRNLSGLPRDITVCPYCGSELV